jgi:LysR family transcriptional regulator, glycine cleavage system transcriptional activator
MQRRLFPPMTALLAFDAVVRLGSFTAAARALDMTQGALSRQVAALEGQLGTVLLARGTRPVAPTAAGRAYATQVRAALAALETGARALGARPAEGVLRLAILPTFGTRWLMPRLPGFIRRHPEVTLQFTTRIGRFDLAAEGVDAAIHSGRAEWPGARLTLLMAERVRPMAAPDLIAGRAGTEGLPHLGLSTRPRGWAEWRAAQGLPPGPEPVQTFEQVATLAQAAAAGLGVALLPTFLVGPELQSGTLVPAGPEAPSGAGYYYAENPDSPAPTALFRDWLVTQIARDTLV